jgi:maleylpyruvate isomerase
MRQLVEIVNAGTQPIQNLAVLRRVSTDKETQAAWARHFIDKGLTAFERLLGEIRSAESITGDFALGDLSLADLFLVPQLYNARRFGVPLDAFPLSLAVEAAARDTESCAAACPDRWEHAHGNVRK